MNSIASGLVEPRRTIIPWLENLKKADVGKYKEKFIFDAAPVVKAPILYSEIIIEAFGSAATESIICPFSRHHLPTGNNVVAQD